MAPDGSGTSLYQELSTHAEVTEDGVARVEGEPQVLATPMHGADVLAGQLVLEVSDACQVTADQPRVQDADTLDAVADDGGLETAAHYLDLR